jgi:hypothetical protein
VKESDRLLANQAVWSYATYHIKDIIDQNMVHALSTLEETQGIEGEGFSCFDVHVLLQYIDTIHRELQQKEVHQTLKEMGSVKLMDILNKLEICTRRVIQNTSIQRLHQKSWVHADALHGNGGAHALSVSDAVFQAPVGRRSQPDANITTLLRQMRQLCV